jgi:methionyl-tRNA synthetase
MNNNKNNFYITTTLPYVNSTPHIGFALEIIQADTIARFKEKEGYEVFFNTGTDEHGLKIYQKALLEKKDPQEYVDEYAKHFKKLKEALNLNYTAFIRTTDKKHILAAQEFWRRCYQKGDIYKGTYEIKYCVGCELEKTESELENGKCPIHPNLEIQIIKEENYFFRFSKYAKNLLELYDKYPDFVLPSWRLQEIKNFVKSGLQDFSISRLRKKMPWGIPVPDDEEHVMYVWFDALINYVSTLDWPNDEKKFESFWGTKENPKAIQIAGKDNLRQQAAMWQAMLFSANLPTSRQILIHGFVTSGGQKMSKSLGNVIDPIEIVQKYGTDALRYYLLREFNPFEDGDFSWEKFKLRYNGDLANGLGNFVARVLALSNNLVFSKNQKLEAKIEQKIKEIENKYKEKLNLYLFNEALEKIWELISFGDIYLNETKPWKLESEEEKIEKLFNVLQILNNLSDFIFPFIPETSQKIKSAITEEDLILKIQKIPNIFPKI